MPQLNVYPVYSVIAEKFHAMVVLGLANSRIKDFFDIHVIACNQQLNSNHLQQALAATFNRRDTSITNEPLLVFSGLLKKDQSKSKQWQSFLSKNNLEHQLSFEQLLEKIQRFIEPVYKQTVLDTKENKKWNNAMWSWE